MRVQVARNPQAQLPSHAGVQWLELLCKSDAETASQARQAAKAAWAKLIRKVCEVDPLVCPKCGAQMRVIAPIEDPAVIERILSWLGLWDPLPKHCGLFGRRASGVPGFEYSDAMKRSKLVWNESTLDRFLADPPEAVPGTKMTYAGVPDPHERADLIAYLKQESASPRCRGA